ncbi:MAG: hypothetical protein J7J20_04670 [Desulfurococcales archaeon]|nr:hypothetical protein [Desulfurococcales archaeon]
MRSREKWGWDTSRKLLQEVLENPRVLYVGGRYITRMTTKGERYLIYLPSNLNDLWRVLWGNKHRIKVYIEIPEAPRSG